MTARLFDNRLSEEWIGFTVLKRLFIAAGIVHFSLAAASGYRAVVQIYSVSIETPLVVSAGTRLQGRVSTAGRTFVDARIEIVQGNAVQQVGAIRIPSNDSFFYDPRAKRVVFDASVSENILSRLKPGRALVRIIAEGRMQWLYIPPPKIEVVFVELR